MSEQHLLKICSSLSGACTDVLSTMMQVGAKEAGSGGRDELPAQETEVHGFVSLGGAVEGCVTVAMALKTATGLCEKFLGEAVAPDSPDFDDALCEITNMIAGGGKSKSDIPGITLGIPSVVVGQSLRVSQPTAEHSRYVQMETDAGPMVLLVSLKSPSEASAPPRVIGARASA